MTIRKSRSYCCRKKFDAVHQFEIALQGIKPKVWRRIQVPSVYSFWELHCAITDVLGWLDYHLHMFTIKFPELGETDIIGIPDHDRFEDDPIILPGWELDIAEYFSDQNATCDYEYDFGDSWLHSVTLEKILPREEGVCYPRCIAGERACPPEDAGGPPGYASFLKSIKYLNAAEHDDFLAWVGGWFDPEWFDLNLIRFENPSTRWRVAFQHAPLPKTMRTVQYHRMKEQNPQ